MPQPGNQSSLVCYNDNQYGAVIADTDVKLWDVSLDMEASKTDLQALKDDTWVDIATRRVTTDISFYNPHIHMYGDVEVQWEFGCKLHQF